MSVAFAVFSDEEPQCGAKRKKLDCRRPDTIPPLASQIAGSLQTLSSNALQLSSLWMDGMFHTMLLVDVEAPEFSRLLPVHVDDFQRKETECAEQVKALLWTTWVPKCVEAFRRSPPQPTGGDADAYYRSIMTLQANQLRDMVQRSLDSLLRFFRCAFEFEFEHPWAVH